MLLMSLMDLYRVLNQTQEIDIVQDDCDGGFIRITVKPDNIPVHILECYVKEVRRGANNRIIVELCR